MIKKTYLVFIVLILMISILAAGNPDIWMPLETLEGKWQAKNDGSIIYQEFQFTLDGKFILMNTKSVFEPSDKNPDGEIHEDIGVFSYDSQRKTHVLRAFYSEGFVNQYVLEKTSAEDHSLTFITEKTENAPEGTRAKLIIKFINDTEMEQSFFVAWPDKEYNCYSTNIFKKL